MKRLLLALIFLSVSGLTTAMESSLEYQEAEKLFKQGKKDEAKQFYLAAANSGDVNAHFALGDRFALPQDERLHHIKMAARGGHSLALDDVLDEIFFRAMSFKYADPEQALAIYQAAKINNPTLRLPNEKQRIASVTQCAEAKGFQFNEFAKKYGASINDSAWKWAREVSSTSSNPTLVFQLVCRGGMVSADVSLAVTHFYGAWKQKQPKKFHECDYVSGFYLLGFCKRQGKLFN